MDVSKTTSTDAFTISGTLAAESRLPQSKFAQLTHSDLKFESGKEKELLGRFESKLNEWHKEMIHIINKNNEEKV